MDRGDTGTGPECDNTIFQGIVPEKVIVCPSVKNHIAGKFSARFKKIVFKNQFASGTYHDLTGKIVPENIMAEHHILHQFPAVLDIHAVTRRIGSVPFNEIVFQDPALTSAETDPQTAIVAHHIMMKMHIGRRQKIIDPQNPGFCRCAGVEGDIRDFRLIEFQIQILCVGRAFDLAVLKTFAFLNKLLFSIVKINLIHPSAHKGKSLITRKIADLKFIFKLCHADHIACASLFRRGDLVTLSVKSTLFQMFFRVNTEKDPFQQFRTVPCPGGNRGKSASGCIQQSQMIQFQIFSADHFQRVSAFVGTFARFVIVNITVAADRAIGQPQIFRALHDTEDCIPLKTVGIDPEFRTIEIDHRIFVIKHHRIFFGNEINPRREYDPVESVFFRILQCGIDPGGSGFRFGAVVADPVFFQIDHTDLFIFFQIGSRFRQRGISHIHQQPFPAIDTGSGGSGFFRHPVCPGLCGKRQYAPQQEQCTQKRSFHHFFISSGSALFYCDSIADQPYHTHGIRAFIPVLSGFIQFEPHIAVPFQMRIKIFPFHR